MVSWSRDKLSFFSLRTVKEREKRDAGEKPILAAEMRVRTWLFFLTIKVTIKGCCFGTILNAEV